MASLSANQYNATNKLSRILYLYPRPHPECVGARLFAATSDHLNSHRPFIRARMFSARQLWAMEFVQRYHAIECGLPYS